MTKGKFILSILFCSFVFMAGACIARADKLNIGLMQDISTLYPCNGGCLHFESALVMQNIYETLFRVKEGSTEIEPWLATGATASMCVVSGHAATGSSLSERPSPRRHGCQHGQPHSVRSSSRLRARFSGFNQSERHFRMVFEDAFLAGST